MKLKEKILIKAVELFNEKGISSTSPNQIAAALNISPGNLTYHYKTKAILVKAVYEKMDTDSKNFIKHTGYLTLNDFRKTMEEFRDFIQKHKFFFQDLAFIVQKYPEVGQLYEKTALSRLKEGRMVFEHFMETGRMISEKEGVNYTYLIHNVWMVGAFWSSQTKIFTSTYPFDQPMDLVEMTWYMLVPYLTKKGKEEYNQINDFLKKTDIVQKEKPKT